MIFSRGDMPVYFTGDEQNWNKLDSYHIVYTYIIPVLLYI